MPLYDYRCNACGQQFELLVRSSTVPACPHCAATALERLVSLTAPQGTSQALIAAPCSRSVRSCGRTARGSRD